MVREAAKSARREVRSGGQEVRGEVEFKRREDSLIASESGEVEGKQRGKQYREGREGLAKRHG